MLWSSAGTITFPERNIEMVTGGERWGEERVFCGNQTTSSR